MSMMEKESIVWGAFSIVLLNPVAQQKQPLIRSLEGFKFKHFQLMFF